VTYLAPIELVSFWNDRMDFGQFKIFRLSKAELETVFRNRTSVVGGTEAERKVIRKSFKELYRTRSKLVHGESTPNDLQASHSRIAWQFPQSLTRWFVRWLDEIVLKANGDSACLPKRRDLLHFLDLESDSRSHIKWLAESMPPSFRGALTGCR
jgi:hypothetical protein